jgi:methanol--5-hydroxybenzimidazolylcobamide Co-methyltransferase
MNYTDVAVKTADDLIFGTAARPVTTPRGLEIGGGTVYPELNFTLPSMTVKKETYDEVKRQYREIADGALSRARELHSEGVVLEFETLLEMTLDPQLGIDITGEIAGICEDYYQKYGLKSELRLTPNDTRDFEHPPKMRSSAYLENMLNLFEGGAKAGGNLLSIESTGGKEIHDDAVLNCDITTVLFAQAVLGNRDMHFLWKKICEIAARTGTIAGGDTACGFANTAMVLAEKHYIPKVFAALVRIISIIRTLPAYEEGAVGPDKDCAYEGPFIKAITGVPISMEGKTAACAHLSPLGNIAGAACDLWSNESVQNVRLLGGMAPTVYLEQLVYDSRAMNTALGQGAGRIFRDIMVESDVHLDPQAFILAPENVITISRELVKGTNPVESAVLAARRGLQLIQAAVKAGELLLEEREQTWVTLLEDQLSAMPTNEDALIEKVMPGLDTQKVILSEYGL